MERVPEPQVGEIDYVTRVFSAPSQIAESAWNNLLAREADPSPFMRHEYLVAMHESGSAKPRAGWQAQFVTLWRGDELQAACPMYLKNNSYGEYVFDWAWANAYAQHGLDYYPKALVAVPFTPVPGARLLARDAAARTALVKALIQQVRDEDLSSVHLLFAQPQDVKACEDAGMMLRHTVQFHWKNEALSAEGLPSPFKSFDHFLSTLQQEKRKKIRQERRKVAEAGVTFRWSRGADIADADWDFFYRCYERTYLEHGNAPYLNRDFFRRMAQTMPQHWLLFVAEREGQAIACSLIGIGRAGAGGLPALRGLLLRSTGLVHRAWFPALRRRCPGRTQDGSRPAPGQDHQRALARPPLVCRCGTALPGAREPGHRPVHGAPGPAQPAQGWSGGAGRGPARHGVVRRRHKRVR